MKMNKALLGLALILPIGAAQAIQCSDSLVSHTPTEQFIDNKDGTITDASTALMWSKCTIGQTYNAETGACNGDPLRMQWHEALNKVEEINNDLTNDTIVRNDWRAPNLKELATLLEYKCYDPAINLDVFPNTPSVTYWSGTPQPIIVEQDQLDTFKYINFKDGTEFTLQERISDGRLLRLVRDLTGD